MPNINKSQVEADEHILKFLGDLKINSAEDLIVLRDKIHHSLIFRPYNDETKVHADSIQWKRTASQIIQDGYVYEGKACSDLSIVFLVCCKASGHEGTLVKYNRIDGSNSHSMIEIQLNDTWYKLDPSSPVSKVYPGQVLFDKILDQDERGGWKVWKKGRDVWDMGLHSIEDEDKLYQ